MRGRAPLLQFGAGAHYCLGAALARVELAETLAVLTRRFGPPAVHAPVTWTAPIGIRGPERLLLPFAEAEPEPEP
ncbi:hypothetical protein MF672_032525 [Actinomadura sp. ATCC 31491]|uniref:Cytochrome P450 n=1 Tax=Actinomadura luzonensis TaxID=2805427 RepID=A0ABT0G1K0_9ACTN|nr:hypothetical protein [Actinomadura luzonensis]MCK2218487.1 hypothetical protein [Actinomadura luzonensis]